ncbi:MAG: urea transport system substrate-binding protein [Solirubrobacteraceae bacterium]|nr:urea transport system substrate-binding protein [Solirubrobacteraceae bacterium]
MDCLEESSGAGRNQAAIDVAVLIPLHGSAGIFGPSCELCARLAADEINAAGGLLGREVRLRVVDGAGPPERVADEIDALVSTGAVDMVVGWHISAVRKAVAPRIAMRVPYVYTAMYEGGEQTPGVFLVGETPDTQLLPAMRWLAHECGVQRWCIVGNDYIWPRRTAAVAQGFAEEIGSRVCEEMFVPLGTDRFPQVIGRLTASRADGVLMLLVGQDAVHFNRAFADAGLDEKFWRLSTCVDENTLLASGADGTHRLCATAAYFASLATPESMAFGARYTARFGRHAPPLNSIGESCYEGMLLLSALVREARSIDVRDMCTAARSLGYAGPRGDLAVRDGHLDQRIYLAGANGLGFEVIAQF